MPERLIYGHATCRLRGVVLGANVCAFGEVLEFDIVIV
jgi:hypothetical protein